jgi:NitT/TauT family transport system substrate-binding protein
VVRKAAGARLIKDDPGRVAEISQIDPAEEERFLTEKNVYYTTTPRGFISFGEFMQSAGLIEEVPGSWKDLVYPNLKNTDGS